MFKYRINAKVDKNQKQIVKALRQIPGVSVEVGHDDILLGYKEKTYWYEIKCDEKAPLKPKQIELTQSWRGHYQVVWCVEQILSELGIKA